MTPTKRFVIGIIIGSIVAIVITMPIIMLLKALGISIPMHFFAVAIAAGIVVWAFRWSHGLNG